MNVTIDMNTVAIIIVGSFWIGFLASAIITEHYQEKKFYNSYKESIKDS